jgi:hypothetical protein
MCRLRGRCASVLSVCSTPGKRAHDAISTEDTMKETTLESLEKRVADRVMILLDTDHLTLLKYTASPARNALAEARQSLNLL